MSLMWMWIVVAVLLVVAEVATLALFAIFLSFGAIGAAVAAFFGLPFLYQAVALAGTSAVGIWVIRPVLLRFKDRYPSASGAAAMVGQTAVVSKATEGVDQLGHVRLGGEDWPARRQDNQPLVADSEVKIVALKGATLIVDPVNQGVSS